MIRHGMDGPAHGQLARPALRAARAPYPAYDRRRLRSLPQAHAARSDARANALLATAHATGHQRPRSLRSRRRALRSRKHESRRRRLGTARLRGRARGHVHAVEEALRFAWPGPRDQGRSARRPTGAIPRASPCQRRPRPAHRPHQAPRPYVGRSRSHRRVAGCAHNFRAPLQWRA